MNITPVSPVFMSLDTAGQYGPRFLSCAEKNEIRNRLLRFFSSHTRKSDIIKNECIG